MTRQWENILRMAGSTAQIVIALAVLLLALISLIGGTYRHVPAIAFCGAAYNLLECLLLWITEGSKHPERRRLFTALTLLCIVFGIVAKMGL